MRSEKRSILMLNYEFPPLGGGGGVASYKLAKGFIKLGYEVDVVTTWFQGTKEFEQKEGINIYRVRIPGRNKKQTASLLSMVLFPRMAYKKAAELMRQNKYSFINTHFAIPTGPLGVRLSREFRVKNILSLHGGDIYDPTKRLSPHRNFLLRWKVRKVLNNSDYIVAQSTNTKENTIKYYHPNKEIAIIPLAYESFKFKKVPRGSLGLEKNKKYVIGVGRLVKRKGFDTAIKAISLIKDENVELLIVGDGPERQTLLNLAKNLGIQHRIHLLGSLSEEKKFQYLDNSNVFLLSSVHEGFGIVLQEAMQVGLPIVSTNYGGQTDFVEKENLIPPSNINAMSVTLEKVIGKSRSGNVNKQIKRFDSSKIAEKYLKIL